MYSINHGSKICPTLPHPNETQENGNIFVRIDSDDMIAKSIRVYGVLFLKPDTENFIKVFSKEELETKIVFIFLKNYLLEIILLYTII